MGMSVQDLSLPPGFRFFPTDEELLVQYLCRKVAGHSFSLQIIAEIDLYKHDPWILPSKAVFGEKEWYFFSPRDRKYPNGSRPNRVAGSGYWKATGTDKIITTEGHKIGIKKALVFYVGKAPKGTKTNWIMHEFRLLETSRKHNSSRLDDWVLCRVYKKGSASHHHQKALLNSNVLNSNDQQSEFSCNSSNSTNSSSQFDDVLDSLTEIEDRSFALPRINSLKSFQDQKIANNNFNNYYSQNLMSSCKLDWSNGLPAGMTEYASNGAHHGVGLGTETSDVYYPSVPPLEDEVESGIGGSGSTGVTHLYHADSLDPFGLRYVMTQQVPGGSW